MLSQCRKSQDKDDLDSERKEPPHSENIKMSLYCTHLNSRKRSFVGIFFFLRHLVVYSSTPRIHN